MTSYQLGYLLGTLATPFFYMFVIGGIYYLIKKRRIPFRQALSNRWVIASSLILFFLNLVSSAGSYLQQEASHDYPKETIRNFTAGCVDRVKARGDNAFAQQVCSCLVVEVQKAYTYGEFKKLTAQMEKSQTLPSGFQSLVTSCNQKQSL